MAGAFRAAVFAGAPFFFVAPLAVATLAVAAFAGAFRAAAFFAGADFAAFFVASIVFFAGVRVFAPRLYFSKAMKSTTLVVAFSGVRSSSSMVAVTPLLLSRFSMTARSLSRKSSR